jgi:hypothetical protein
VANTRHKNAEWTVGDEHTGEVPTWERAGIAVLMDLRDELQEMNRTLSVLKCINFIRIPRILDGIRKNTTRKRRQTKKP